MLQSYGSHFATLETCVSGGDGMDVSDVAKNNVSDAGVGLEQRNDVWGVPVLRNRKARRRVAASVYPERLSQFNASVMNNLA